MKDYTKTDSLHDVDTAVIVLNKCGFSEEMVKHLANGHLVSGSVLIDIVCQAPISLDEKLELLLALSNQNDHTDERLTSKITDAIAELQEAKAAIETCGSGSDDRVLYLFDEWYDTDSFIEKSSGVGLFQSEEEIKRWIKAEYYSEDGADDESWGRAELWRLSDLKWEQPRYDYYLCGDEIFWFEKLYPKKQANGNTYYLWQRGSNRRFARGSHDLNLSTPYQPGDIVSIDCRPFGPPFHAVILEARNQWDCCFPTIVFKVPYTDKWSITSLKHKRFFHHAELSSYEPMLSPLYRIHAVKGEELTEEDAELRLLSDWLEGSEEKAEKLWETGIANVQEILITKDDR